ncbi:hypothetical protein M440DRAFT_1002824 [Trichoderma longibrachiatum ATCC 18648]|uniref:Transmembrane protein n=1 Tax=Trichoderma longibrachiatum ATCC 18648 TaxID=983965 RepID=A0A2T4CHD8_TRILO|nr:hypothetical protein M440DRAFT_1002824 [Trichoderma longibrachiatum ATCC 18648]
MFAGISQHRIAKAHPIESTSSSFPSCRLWSRLGLAAPSRLLFLPRIGCFCRVFLGCVHLLLSFSSIFSVILSFFSVPPTPPFSLFKLSQLSGSLSSFLYLLSFVCSPSVPLFASLVSLSFFSPHTSPLPPIHPTSHPRKTRKGSGFFSPLLSKIERHAASCALSQTPGAATRPLHPFLPPLPPPPVQRAAASGTRRPSILGLTASQSANQILHALDLPRLAS